MPRILMVRFPYLRKTCSNMSIVKLQGCLQHPPCPLLAWEPKTSTTDGSSTVSEFKGFFSPKTSFNLTCCCTEPTTVCEFFLTRFFKLLFRGLYTTWGRSSTPQSPCKPRTNKLGLEGERFALPSLVISVC